ncbi:kinesin-like protein KIF15-B [Hypomesus transpacificus]|uniref:kinesin-like protein KIF15-B n=1 Tax=Hypomesus transpacificus TaxID=137520 RepID=UPI001F077D8D|nr:kinesin-like protein KIF15-B [Hypomesus transpacificus]
MNTTKNKDAGDSSQLAASGDSDSIKVFVRVRPMTQGSGLTTDGDHGLCLTVTSHNTIRLHSKPEPRNFTYDHVADMDTSQEAVFSSVAKNIVESCINGYNGTIFAYGQTGSGKTFTMLGPSDSDNFTDDLRGVIPRSFEYLFFLINREVEKSGNTKSFLCKCSFIEIYNEQIYDLLDSASASLFLRENIKKGVFVEGSVEKFVTSAAEAYQVLSMGWRNRRVASTSMNRESSRSHAVFTMTLESKETANEVFNIRTSQLNLVDLAGSERQRDTHTEGSRLKEASSINRSLMCLGQVIMALVDVSNGKSRHICYRDSKLTFLLRDSLGGNAKTYIIANVHPGSKCFGETLSTLHFAQRAKLIKNKAMINEDTQGNVRQLQAEVKKLKELLVLAGSGLPHTGEDVRDGAPGGPQPPADPSIEGPPEVSYKTQFLDAVRLWKRREDDKRMLLQKVAQLEEAWTHKEKFIHSNRMILKFREDHISRLEKNFKGGLGLLSDQQSQALVHQLKEEIKILKQQIEHHPRITKYMAENYSLREENCQLRSSESVRRAEEVDSQAAAELEKAFQKVLEAEGSAGAQPAGCTPATAENLSAVSVERLKAQLLQKQTELTATVQAFEEHKEVTKKQMLELESEKRYLDKSNKHLENILEATKAHKKLEVSQLNKIHAETIKILTTPTKSYNLRTRLVPLSSPDHLSGGVEDLDGILSEQPPPQMEDVCEALTEELQQVQDQASRIQSQLDDEELQNRKLLQQITKLQEQVALMSEDSARQQELLSSDRASWGKERDSLQESVSRLEKSLQEERQAGEVLSSEVQDLRLVLQSSDRELAAAKKELKAGRSEQEREAVQFSSSLISTQLQLDKFTLEREQLLEQQRSLQDALDQLQAEAKFDVDQLWQHLEEKQQEIATQQAQITGLVDALQAEKELTGSLTFKLKEDKECTSKELVLVLEQNSGLRKQVSELMAQNQQQTVNIASLEQNLTTANGTITSLDQKVEQDKGFVLDLINQTRDLRSELGQKEENLALLSGDIKDITVKYSAACCEREEIREHSSRMEAELLDVREAAERRVASNQIELEVLQEEVTYATEEVERLTKVLDEQTGLLQASQEQAAQNETTIQTLQDKLKQQADLVERTIRSDDNDNPLSSVTPKQLPQMPATPHSFRLATPHSFSTDLSQLLESQERELESRCSSMMTMEVLLSELNAERTAKNEEILRLKAQLNKDMERNKTHGLLDQLCTKQNQTNGNTNGAVLNEAIQQSMLKELQEERVEKSTILQRFTETQERLQLQESMLAQSQTCVQELTHELRNRCLEVRELSLRNQDQERLIQEVEVLRKQVDHLSEENGKLVGHKNHKQRIEYLVKLKKENTKLQEENEKLRTEK